MGTVLLILLALLIIVAIAFVIRYSDGDLLDIYLLSELFECLGSIVIAIFSSLGSGDD
jgi:hypothetical protein